MDICSPPKSPSDPVAATRRERLQSCPQGPYKDRLLPLPSLVINFFLSFAPQVFSVSPLCLFFVRAFFTTLANAASSSRSPGHNFTPLAILFFPPTLTPTPTPSPTPRPRPPPPRPKMSRIASLASCARFIDADRVLIGRGVLPYYRCSSRGLMWGGLHMY